MAITVHPNQARDDRPELKPHTALRLAWYVYVGMLFVPFVMAVAVMLTLSHREGTLPRYPLNYYWFGAAVTFIIVAAPISFLIRSRLFKAYYTGAGVSPRDYLTGMLVVWSTFEVGGIVSLLGCLVGNSLLPNLLPALAAFMFFTPLYPNGRAMLPQKGNTDDPEIYHEPR